MKNDGDLVSNCCAWDFEPTGFEKEPGIWQERCLKCGKLCEPLYIGTRDIENIHRAQILESSPPPAQTEALEELKKFLQLYNAYFDEAGAYEGADFWGNDEVKACIDRILSLAHKEGQREERERIKNVINYWHSIGSDDTAGLIIKIQNTLKEDYVR